MKIPHEKIKPFTTEIAPECSQQITALKNTGDMTKFTTGLDNIVEWCSVFGKTEMGRWADVLNDCDAILAAATEMDINNCLQIDRDDSLDQPLISILRFTSLLFENTFSRSVYSSIEHLIKLLDSRKIFIVVQTLRLLMVISKSSRFITQHLSQEFRIELYNRLSAILEIWSGRLRGVKLTEFCSVSFTSPASLNQIQIQQEMSNYQIDTTKTLTESMIELKDFLAGIDLQKAEIVYAFAKLRFVYSIKHHNERFYNVMARQIATSIIFYSRYLLGDESRLNGLANDQYIEQCCELLRFEGPPNHRILTDALKTETLKTLASIVFLEKVKKIQLIVDSLELRNYHGFCPTLIRQCTDRLKSVKLEASGDFSMTFITSLFSLIYHIAGFAYGGDALNHSSIIPILLSVIKAHDLPENYISYVTRSVRIIDILTGTEVIEFNANDGTETMINRFTHEIDQSKKHMEQMQMESKPILCNQQRSALMKSMLNFLKRAVMDFNLIVHIRRMMGADLPDALKHIIDNPKYYGSSLLHCAIALVTSFIYQEPAQLTTLQTKGLTDAIMKLIFSEKFPISRDLICVLVNVCSALCLNERGLNELKTYNNQKPISKIFNLIFSNRFLLSIRKRKTEILETAHMLGTSFDELIRHQPTLRREVMGTIAAVLDSILEQLKKKDISISWNIGKCALEEDPKAEHLPMGDFIGMMGIMFETMLTNRGIQDNIVVFNECGIPSRLVKMLSQAVNPNPILLNSNYLPNLANILCCVMRQISKVDDGFTHLVEACTIELDGYASIKDTPQERLGQITRLSSLVSTMNNLMKSVIHSQNAYDIRPFLLHHFANDKIAQRFMVSLFDTYKLMSSDKLLSAAQQTTTQILEDATKVQELLQINDQDNLMEVDDADQRTQVSQHSSQESSDRSVSQIIDRATTSNDGETISITVGTTGTTETMAPDVVTERSIQQVAYRCQRQISELIVCLGKNFCNANVTRVRQRTAQILQINQDTLKKDYREVSKQVFTGLNRLLVAQTIGADGHEIASIPGNHIIQSLSLLKKVLIDDQSIQQMLPDFYTSECHKTFFDLVNNSLKSNLTKEDYISALHSWLNISQKLTSINLLDPTKQGRNGAQPRPPIASVVEGFELKNYLAASQKDMFMALCLLLNAIIAHCKESVQFTADPSPSTSMPPEAKEKQNKPFKLFEKLLESLKLLFKDMIKLLDLSENAEETHQEVPVNEIDPAKIQQLVEMGFSQSDALDALLQFSTIAEAAEYLVSQMERNIAMRAQAQHNEAAAAMVAPAPAETIADAGQEQQTHAGASTASITVEKMNPFAELKPLTRELLQERMQQSQQFIFNGLNLMSGSQSLVNAVAELIAIFGDEPVGRAWVLGEFINRLKSELNTQIDHSMSNRNAGSLIEQFAATLHFFNLIRQAFPDQQIDGENGTTESDFTMMCTE